MRVRISGSRYGFDWAKMTQTSQTMLGMSRHDAERLADLVSSGEVVQLNMPDETGRQYVRRLQRLHVAVEALDD